MERGHGASCSTQALAALSRVGGAACVDAGGSCPVGLLLGLPAHRRAPGSEWVAGHPLNQAPQGATHPPAGGRTARLGVGVTAERHGYQATPRQGAQGAPLLLGLPAGSPAPSARPRGRARLPERSRPRAGLLGPAVSLFSKTKGRASGPPRFWGPCVCRGGGPRRRLRSLFLECCARPAAVCKSGQGCTAAASMQAEWGLRDREARGPPAGRPHVSPGWVLVDSWSAGWGGGGSSAFGTCRHAHKTEGDSALSGLSRATVLSGVVLPRLSLFS